jgi:hypothetical protein
MTRWAPPDDPEGRCRPAQRNRSSDRPRGLSRPRAIPPRIGGRSGRWHRCGTRGGHGGTCAVRRPHSRRGGTTAARPTHPLTTLCVRRTTDPAAVPSFGGRCPPCARALVTAGGRQTRGTESTGHNGVPPAALDRPEVPDVRDVAHCPNPGSAAVESARRRWGGWSRCPCRAPAPRVRVRAVQARCLHRPDARTCRPPLRCTSQIQETHDGPATRRHRGSDRGR